MMYPFTRLKACHATVRFVIPLWLLSVTLAGPLQTASASSATITPTEKFPMRAFTDIAPMPISVKLSIPADASAQTITVSTLLQDIDDSVVAKRQSTLSVEPGKDYPLSVSLTAPDYGYYSAKMTATGKDGQTIATFSTGFGVLRSLTPRQQKQNPSTSMFGVNFHYDQGQGDLHVTPQLMKMAGIRWLRDTISWPKVERTRGRYSVPDANREAYKNALNNYGIRTLAILAYDNPSIYPHTSSNEVRGYGDYAEYVAEALAGTVDDFEIWNEPNNFAKLTAQQYVPVLKAGYEGVKKGNPNALVIGVAGASPGGWGSWYIPEIKKQGAAGYMDAFSVHPYTSPYSADVGYVTKGGLTSLSNLDNGAAITLNLAKSIASAHGWKRPPGIWITEIGWPSNVVGLKAQAQEIARAYLTAASLPDLYARMFAYDFVCDGPSPKSKEDNFGMVGYDYSVRPAYVATAAASRAIDGRPFLRRLPHPNDTVRLYLFGPEDDPLLVAYVTETSPKQLVKAKLEKSVAAADIGKAGSAPNATVRVRLRVSSDQVVLRNWQDQERKIFVKDGAFNAELSTWPVYLHGLGPAGRIRVSK